MTVGFRARTVRFRCPAVSAIHGGGLVRGAVASFAGRVAAAAGDSGGKGNGA